MKKITKCYISKYIKILTNKLIKTKECHVNGSIMFIKIITKILRKNRR